MFKQTIALIAVFLLGAAIATIVPALASPSKDLQVPETNAEGGFEYKEPSTFDRLFGVDSVVEKQSPSNRIGENQILVTKEGVQIDIKDATWATFTDTNSMDPVIDAGANAIEVAPKSEDDLEVGDIVAYKSDYAEGTIIHRIAYKGTDEKGTYFVLKGDNNPTSDPGRIRFSQIKSVVVAIIY